MRMSQGPCILLGEPVDTPQLLWLRTTVPASETVEEGGEVSFFFIVFVFCFFVVFPAKITVSFLGLDHGV